MASEHKYQRSTNMKCPLAHHNNNDKFDSNKCLFLNPATKPNTDTTTCTLTIELNNLLIEFRRRTPVHEIENSAQFIFADALNNHRYNKSI